MQIICLLKLQLDLKHVDTLKDLKKEPITWRNDEDEGLMTINMSKNTNTLLCSRWNNGNEYNKYAFNWNKNTTWPGNNNPTSYC